jgi:O-acetyl-ADP-ribose deacetylase (regulator of RNase III)/cold shock CspA family protein
MLYTERHVSMNRSTEITFDPTTLKQRLSPYQYDCLIGFLQACDTDQLEHLKRLADSFKVDSQSVPSEAIPSWDPVTHVDHGQFAGIVGDIYGDDRAEPPAEVIDILTAWGIDYVEEDIARLHGSTAAIRAAAAYPGDISAVSVDEEGFGYTTTLPRPGQPNGTFQPMGECTVLYHPEIPGETEYTLVLKTHIDDLFADFGQGNPDVTIHTITVDCGLICDWTMMTVHPVISDPTSLSHRAKLYTHRAQVLEAIIRFAALHDTFRLIDPVRSLDNLGFEIQDSNLTNSGGVVATTDRSDVGYQYALTVVRGTVTHIDGDGQWGYIETPVSTRDAVFHFDTIPSAIETLAEGQTVEFVFDITENGPHVTAIHSIVHAPTISLLHDDLAAVAADALVCPTGTSLWMQGGVAGALKEAAGSDIEQAAVEHGPIEVGEAVLTDAFDLPATAVIHVATDVDGRYENTTAASIRQATRSVLEAAETAEITELALPLLGCGSAGVDLEEGATAIYTVIDGYESSCLEQIYLVAYTREDYRFVESLLDTRKKDG